jgi:hypothetical protein
LIAEELTVGPEMFPATAMLMMVVLFQQSDEGRHHDGRSNSMTAREAVD